MFKQVINYFKNYKPNKIQLISKVEDVTLKLLNETDPKKLLEIRNEIKNDKTLRSLILSQDTIDLGIEKKAITKSKKTVGDMFFHFFGMNDTWSTGRNLLGMFLVHSPEYPTYFIPAYTQAKATGSAHELKKGEGARGVITGGLEGLAVGALVSGKILKPNEMIPYIIMGAGLQLFSSKVFPWIGEKVGQFEYKKNTFNKNNQLVKNEATPATVAPATEVKAVDKSKTAPGFNAPSPYSTYKSNGLKI